MRYAQSDKIAELAETLRQQGGRAALSIIAAARGWAHDDAVYAAGGAVRDGLCVLESDMLVLIEPDPHPGPRHVPRSLILPPE